jgi:hypothetical protein
MSNKDEILISVYGRNAPDAAARLTAALKIDRINDHQAEPARLPLGGRQQSPAARWRDLADRQRSGGTEGWQPRPHQKTGILKKHKNPDSTCGPRREHVPTI